ncbi:hypothetical protein TI39_contig5869g00001 [Zymoseptoria brevis]|uniref:Uncharacterized protein n=1 Tax=Zymoseptoria brevis TaxID=1047168 RepID=A0A0F4G7U3_9PEZI|nr:hypothetical protein TI39_contig5869g00001 [Zymoseptoria brevis]
MHNRSSQGHQRRATSLLATATLLASAATLTTALSPSVLITVEASSGGAGNNLLSNITLSIPLSTSYTNPALDTVSTLYLTGATGADPGSITCYPFQDSDLTNPGGQPVSQFKPSRLGTNHTVQVGSIVCNSTDTSDGNDATGVTSTLHATSTQLTRGSVSDVPNLGANVSVPLGPGPVILSSTFLFNTSSTSSTSTSSNNATTSSTSTSLPTVTNTSGGGGLVGPPRTVTSVTSLTPSGSSDGAMVTETRTEVVVPSTTTTGSSVEGSGTAVVQGSQGMAAGSGRRVESWIMFAVAGGFGLLGIVVLAG